MTEAPPDDGSKALIALALAGQKSAVRTLVARLLPVIQARVDRRLMRSPSRRIGPYDRDDAMQEIWLVLVKGDGAQLRDWDPERGASLEGYVGMVAEREMGNLARRELRTVKRHMNLVSEAVEDVAALAVGADSPESHAIAKETSANLQAYVAERLPAKGRTICQYLYGEQLSPDAVAETLNVTRQVVYNWQHRIRRIVEDFFQKAPAE